MKKIFIFSLFVIGMTIATCTVFAQNVEEHVRVVGLQRLDSNSVIRFTVDVDHDSSLCSNPIKAGECYVLSKKIKKYIFTSITKTPNISNYHASTCFSNPYSGVYVSWNEDFGIKTPDVYTRSFPWFTSIRTSQLYYYAYNEKEKSFYPQIAPSTSGKLGSWTIIGWISMLVWFFGVFVSTEDDIIFQERNRNEKSLLLSITLFALGLIIDSSFEKDISIIFLVDRFLYLIVLCISSLITINLIKRTKNKIYLSFLNHFRWVYAMLFSWSFVLFFADRQDLWWVSFLGVICYMIILPLLLEAINMLCKRITGRFIW